MAHQVINLFPDETLEPADEKSAPEANDLSSSDDNNEKSQKIEEPKVTKRLQVDIDSIKIDYYPRERESCERIKVFVEMLESGTVFPPIKLVEEKGSFYLIDGMHRTKANKKIGNDTIEAEVLDLERRFWPAFSVRYNNGQSLQLKDGELKNAVWRVYSEDKLSKRQIADIFGQTYQWVIRTTEIRTNIEKRKLAEKCWELAQEGASIRGIEKKTGVSRSTASRLIKEEEQRREELRQEEEKRQERAIRAQEKAKERALKRAQKFARENENCVELSDGNTMEIEKSNCVFAKPETIFDDDSDEAKSLLEGITDPCCDFLTADQLEFSKIQPCETYEYPLPNYSVPMIVGLEKYFGKIEKNEKATLYVLHHIDKEKPIEEIAKSMSCPVEWVRNTAFALLHYYHYKDIGEDEVAAALSIGIDRAKFIKFLYEHYKASLPEREGLFLWIGNNMPKYRDEQYIEITRREKLYWYCKREGKPVPWENKEEPVCYDIPLEVADTTEKMTDYLLNLQIQINKLKLNKMQSQVLLEKFNRLTILVNSIIRFLSENAHRDED